MVKQRCARCGRKGRVNTRAPQIRSPRGVESGDLHESLVPGVFVCNSADFCRIHNEKQCYHGWIIEKRERVLCWGTLRTGPSMWSRSPKFDRAHQRCRFDKMRKRWKTWHRRGFLCTNPQGVFTAFTRSAKAGREYIDARIGLDVSVWDANGQPYVLPKRSKWRDWWEYADVSWVDTAEARERRKEMVALHHCRQGRVRLSAQDKRTRNTLAKALDAQRAALQKALDAYTAATAQCQEAVENYNAVIQQAQEFCNAVKALPLAALQQALEAARREAISPRNGR